MLFEYGCDRSIFTDLEIAQEKELCETYMGHFPVISISFKGVNADSFEVARFMMCPAIGMEAMRFDYLLDGKALSGKGKNLYSRLTGANDQNDFLR